MKRKILIFLVFTATFIFLILPFKFLNADPVNFVVNGDFETGIFDPWQEFGSSVINDNGNWVARHGLTDNSWIGQDVSVSTRNLLFSFSFKPMVFSNDPDESTIGVYLKFYKNGNKVGDNLLLTIVPGDFPLGIWATAIADVPFWYQSVYGSALPDIDKVSVNATYQGGVANYIYFDDFILSRDILQTEIQTQLIQAKTSVRTKQMTCWQVWINEDNNFEFIFWWEYGNNNWVKIYDMAGNEVFSIDMKKGNPRFEADLPDGMYTVKTFHDGFEKPIQEFIIGKP